MNNKFHNNGILFVIIIVVSLIFLYAGLFLSVRGGGAGNGEGNESGEGTAGGTIPMNPVPDPDEAEPEENPVKYIHRSETIHGLRQEIHLLEVDPGSPDVTILPVLSHDLIYGFEKLSEMAARKNAYAAVNGGFFHEFGLPSGMVAINGNLLSASTGKYPVFTIENGKASLREFDSNLSIGFRSPAVTADPAGGGTAPLQNSIPVDRLNFPAGTNQTAVYTPVFGKTNRAQARNITATVENGVITRVAEYSGEAAIPENGMLISFFNMRKYAGIELPVKVGDVVELGHQPEIGIGMQAYECGCWLVKDGASVVGEKDAWVGVLTNRDPRTAIGIRDDGTVLLITVDGRQPGYSAGFTGKELADYLITCGAKQAAMLDGGASTEMLLEGRLVNSPSYKGEERQLAGGILIVLKENTKGVNPNVPKE